MKKAVRSILTLALAAALTAPCFAAEAVPQQPEETPAWSGFADVAEDRWSYDTIRYCCEAGLFLGTSEDTFDPEGVLTVDQALVLAARLYSLTHSPALPGAEQTFVRFLAEDGTEIASYSWEAFPTYNASGQLFVAVSDTADDPDVPETCTMELGVEGYGPIQSFQGKKESYDPPAGVMTQGLRGTGYRFADEGASDCFLELVGLQSAAPEPGVIPELPDLTQPWLTIYAEDGTVLLSRTLDENPGTMSSMGKGVYLAVSDAYDDPSVPETCTMTVGFEGYGQVRTFAGVRETYAGNGGHMSYGMEGTGFRFEEDGVSMWMGLIGSAQFKDAWWYPAFFYLSSARGLDIRGDLVYRLIQPDEEGVYHSEDIFSYDPVAGFARDAADRTMFAVLVDRAVEEDLEAINDAGNIPDVTEEFGDHAAIRRLYGAGILTGVDGAGTFHGAGVLTREQAAAILARVLDPAQRIRI